MQEAVNASLAQFSPELLQPGKNAERMAEIAIEEASTGADLVVFPELSNTGYISPFHGLDPDFARAYVAAAEPVPGPTTQALGEVAKDQTIHVVVGLSQEHPVLKGCMFNTAVIIGPDGSIVGQQHKTHLPAGEKHYFTPGSELCVFGTELGNIGLSICYDGRFPETARVLALKGADIVCAIWARFQAAGYLAGTSNHHMAFVRAQENAIFYLHCNRTGRQGEYYFLGHSAIGAPNGELVVASDGAEEECVRGTLDASRIVDSRMFLNIFRDRRPDLYGRLGAELA